ncbi:GreA/GreB family elongation factor [Candidatus Methylocalor cossyra]|uniref:Transcription elongation factor GreB n=1 Tax=Candidatus Methylocalor cossyra TaxID=3108543 RepID=A0ABM9NIK5_9GAMM
MSRAFVKETDGQDDVALPERPQSPHVNYITPAGFERLQAQVRELSALRNSLAEREDLGSRQQLKLVERDLGYYTERLRRAVVVQPEGQPGDRVHFGATVEVEDAEGQRTVFTIVGEDEADAATGRISWVSPLARALLNARVGQTVLWKRPIGDKELEIISIGKG